ncbi:hypothetical protein [Agromyces sp. NPDC055661]
MPIPTRRRTVRRGAVAAAAATGLALVLAGCVGAPAATPTPSPADTSAPIFASDEEALAAAEATYGRFIENTTAVTNGGGAAPESLDSVASGDALDEEQAAAQRFREQGLRTTGAVGFRVTNLQSIAEDPYGVEITFYVCDDLRQVDLLNGAGESMVVEGRVVDVPYTVVVSGEDADSLRVSEKELWTRDNFCLA